MLFGMPGALAKNTPSGKRLLLLSYHFPPSDATGALRWQKLVCFAAERGWAVDVLTRHPDGLNNVDFNRLAQLPASTRVYAVRASTRSSLNTLTALLVRVKQAMKKRRKRMATNQLHPLHTPNSVDLVWRNELKWRMKLSQLRTAYHAWRHFADEWIWARAALDAGRELGAYDAVVSCGPPHMPHVAARQLAQARGVPFIMDMRDPWSLAPAVPVSQASPLWYNIAEKHERACVESAALVVANTEALAQAMRALYPKAANRIVTVMNGCDDDIAPTGARADRFTMCYAGNIYIDRDPTVLFKALGNFIRAEQLTPEQFRLELVGYVDRIGGRTVHDMAADAGLTRFLAIHPRMPRKDALAIMSKAAVLVSLPQDVDLAIPSKIFEYMQYPAWLISLAKRGSATEQLLRDTRAHVIEPDDMEGLTRTMRELWRQYSAGQTAVPVNADGRFGRAAQADVLFQAIDRICGHATTEQNEAA